MKSEGVCGEEGWPIAAAPRRERGGERSEEGCRVQGRRAGAAPSPPGPACPPSVPASPGPRVLTPQTTGRLAGGSGPARASERLPWPGRLRGARRSVPVRPARRLSGRGRPGPAPPRGLSNQRFSLPLCPPLRTRPADTREPRPRPGRPVQSERPIPPSARPSLKPRLSSISSYPAPLPGATPPRMAPPRVQSLVQSCPPISQTRPPSHALPPGAPPPRSGGPLGGAARPGSPGTAAPPFPLAWRPPSVPPLPAQDPPGLAPRTSRAHGFGLRGESSAAPKSRRDLAPRRSSGWSRGAPGRPHPAPPAPAGQSAAALQAPP